jgi:hypothetical protein
LIWEIEEYWNSLIGGKKRELESNQEKERERETRREREREDGSI